MTWVRPKVYSMAANCRLYGHRHCPDELCTCPCHDTAEDREDSAQAGARVRARCTGEDFGTALAYMREAGRRELEHALRPYPDA